MLMNTGSLLHVLRMNGTIRSRMLTTVKKTVELGEEILRMKMEEKIARTDEHVCE